MEIVGILEGVTLKKPPDHTYYSVSRTAESKNNFSS